MAKSACDFEQALSTAGIVPVLAILVLALTTLPAFARKQPQPNTIRWDESRPGCTFSATSDGKYNYGLWVGDIVLTLSVDAQELEKIRRRAEPFFGVFADVRYRGASALDLQLQNATLEFVKHFKVVQPSLDPDSFAEKIQKGADDLDYETAREIESHPERKEEKEKFMREYQKDTAELLEFVTKNSLQPARLTPNAPQTSGWLLFSTRSKWLGNWKKQEEFILRMPLEGKIYEFPIKLPHKPGELVLRQRN